MEDNKTQQKLTKERFIQIIEETADKIVEATGKDKLQVVRELMEEARQKLIPSSKDQQNFILKKVVEI